MSNQINPENNHDIFDMVKRESVLVAGSLKIAAYRVRDPETLEWSKLQFHMTYDNLVLAVMPEEAARLFASFVTKFNVEENK